jgi:glycosyltransferase involved in cell wall biosynthesis
LICEEALKDEVGHWFEYCHAVETIHDSYGVETLILAHADVAPSVRRAANALPFFRETSWDGMNEEPSALKRYWGIVTHNWLVFRSVDAFLRARGSFDLVFAPTVTIHHLLGWRLVAALHCGGRVGRLVILFRNNVGYYTEGNDRPRFRRASVLFAWLMKSFDALVRSGRVSFATDSERLADEYEALSMMRPIVFPSPRIAPPVAMAEVDAAASRPAGPFRFSCLGPARFEKGVDILQEAIKLLLMRRGGAESELDVRFMIQWNSEILDAHGEPYRIDPALAADDRVEFVTAPLDAHAYAAALRRTHCMVLPYRRAAYFARISGVAVEAATAGIPVIFTKGTWCESFVESCGVGLGVADGDASGLADAMEAMIADYGAYQSRAVARAALARSKNAADGFVRALWGFDSPTAIRA